MLISCPVYAGLAVTAPEAVYTLFGAKWLEMVPLVQLFGGKVREGVTTDNGNVILDVHQLAITDPLKLEQQINNIVGVVCNGIFAQRAADMVLVGAASGTQVIR